MQTTTYKLNVTPGGVPLTIHISQYDVGLRQYTFQPYTNVGEFTYVSGATVTLEATKPDGYGVVHECTYNQDGITYTLQEQLAAKPGRVWSKVVIRDGADVLGTGAVIWIVDCAGLKDDAIVSESDMSGIRGMIDAEVKHAMSESVISSLPNSNASGAVAHFTDGAYDIPVRDLKIGIVPKQSGTGDPSPSNVRPITGWTGANVVRTGKNLIDDSIKTVQSASTCVIGQTSTSTFNVYLPAGTYTISFGSSKAPGIYYRLSTESSGSHTVITYGNSTGTFTLTANAHLRIWAYLSSGITPSDIDWFQLEPGSIATEYESYTAQTYPISFGSAGTVYGGMMDVTNGVLTVTDGYIAEYAGETLPYTWISDRDIYASGTLPTTGAQVVYKLAIPVTYQLIPAEVHTLLGNNSIWADTGDTEVEYKADTTLYIDSKLNATKSIIAGVEVEYKATKNYSIGNYVIVNDALYKVTSAIASGASITPGTNCTQTTVAEQLILLANA